MGISSTVNPNLAGAGGSGSTTQNRSHHTSNWNTVYSTSLNTSSQNNPSTTTTAGGGGGSFDDSESIGLLREASTSSNAQHSGPFPSSNSGGGGGDEKQFKRKGSRCEINLALFGLEDSGKSTLIKNISVLQQQLRGPRKRDDRDKSASTSSSSSQSVPSSSSSNPSFGLGNSALLLYKNDIIEYLLRCVKEVTLCALIHHVSMSDDQNNQLLAYFASADPSEIDLAAATPTTQSGGNPTPDVGSQIARLWNDRRLREFVSHYWKYSLLSSIPLGSASKTTSTPTTTIPETEMRVKPNAESNEASPDSLIPAPSWPYNAEYFFASAQRIMHRDYTPTMQDVLFCKTDMMGFNSQDDLEVDYNGLNFRIIGIGQRSEPRVLDHLIAIAIMIPLDEYDLAREFHGTSTNVVHTITGASLSSSSSSSALQRYSNRLLLTYQLFDDVCNSSWGIEFPIILILNKADRFARKIQQRDLSVCFPDYKDGKNYTAAIKYIVTRFARLNRNKNRSIYYNVTSAINAQDVTSTLTALFNCLREIILYNNLRDTNII